MTSEEALNHVRSKTDTVYLSFSRGKDALAAWLTLQPIFPKIIPVHMQVVPNLKFVEDSLRYYEDFFKTPIIREIHPNFFRLLSRYVFQTPERIRFIKNYAWPKRENANDLYARLKKANPYAYHGYAMSINDSSNRRIHIGKYGAVQDAKKKFYVNHDWTIHQIRDSIAKSGVKLPVDYLFHKRSFNGIDFRACTWIKKMFPEDYERIKFWFPLIDAEILRMEYRTKYIKPKDKPDDRRA